MASVLLLRLHRGQNHLPLNFNKQTTFRDNYIFNTSRALFSLLILLSHSLFVFKILVVVFVCFFPKNIMFFICFHPSAHRMHLSPMENVIISRLLTPTQASLARSRSTLILFEQYNDSGKPNPRKNVWGTMQKLIRLGFSYRNLFYSMYVIPVLQILKKIQFSIWVLTLIISYIILACVLNVYYS